MVQYALHYAKDISTVKFDVFNCLSIMDNDKFHAQLKFGLGDGILNYYFYNYQLRTMVGGPECMAIMI